MTTRQRNQLTQSAYNSQAAQLPALIVPRTGNPALDQFLAAVKERMEVREGTRGNPFEAVVTHRDLVDAGVISVVGRRATPGDGVSIDMIGPNGQIVTVGIEQFAELIRKTDLYRDLIREINDPGRFDRLALPESIRQVLLQDLAKEAAQRGADISQLERKIQTDIESTAFRLNQITAGIRAATAGVRQMAFATAADGRATAGLVTTITARLNNFDGGGATVETVMTAMDSRVDGTEAQYTLKLSASGKVAGFGLASTAPTSGSATSAMVILADKFAIVTSGDSVPDPLNPPTDRIPFGVDASGVYINGFVRINASGGTLESVSKRIVITAPTNVFRVDASAVATPTSILLTATRYNGLTGTATWSVVSGTATLTGSGDTRTLTYANLTTDQATIRVSVTDTSVTYTWDYTIYKVVDGATGTTGAAGARGSLIGNGSQYSISVGAWSDAKANRVIDNMLTGGTSTADLATTTHLRVGDTVTLGNGTTFAQTRFWGGSWLVPGVVIDGNVLVNGTVGANAMAANSITAANAALGTASVETLKIAGNAVTLAKVKTQPKQHYIPRDGYVTITAISRTSNVVTVTTTARSSSLPANTLLCIYSGTHPQFNGTFRCSPVTGFETTKFTYTLTGANETASGSVGGYVLPFAGIDSVAVDLYGGQPFYVQARIELAGATPNFFIGAGSGIITLMAGTYLTYSDWVVNPANLEVAFQFTLQDSATAGDPPDTGAVVYQATDMISQLTQRPGETTSAIITAVFTNPPSGTKYLHFKGLCLNSASSYTVGYRNLTMYALETRR